MSSSHNRHRALLPGVLHKSDPVVMYKDCSRDSAIPVHCMVMSLSEQSLAMAMGSHCCVIRSEPNLHRIPISTELAGTSSQENVMGVLPSTLPMSEELNL